MFAKIYNWIITYSKSPYASWILGLLSFAESSVSPIPPDPLMVPMIIAKSTKAYRYALITTSTSVIGGILGYGIGYFLFETIGHKIITFYGLMEKFYMLQQWFNKWGFAIIVIKGLLPIPYKIVTITSGVTKMNLIMFTCASLLSRGARFYLLAFLLKKYGQRIHVLIEKNITLVSFIFIGVLVLGFFMIKWFI